MSMIFNEICKHIGKGRFQTKYVIDKDLEGNPACIVHLTLSGGGGIFSRPDHYKVIGNIIDFEEEKDDPFSDADEVVVTYSPIINT